MSLTSGAPQPTLAWTFENSNVDSVSSIAPTTSSGPPTYNSAGKYGSSIVFNNTPGATTGAYYLKYTTGISLSTATSFTICLWIKPLALEANATGNQRYISISDGGRCTRISWALTGLDHQSHPPIFTSAPLSPNFWRYINDPLRTPLTMVKVPGEVTLILG